MSYYHDYFLCIYLCNLIFLVILLTYCLKMMLLKYMVQSVSSYTNSCSPADFFCYRLSLLNKKTMNSLNWYMVSIGVVDWEIPIHLIVCFCAKYYMVEAGVGVNYWNN